MAIRRITISVPETLAEQIKKAAGDKPVSQYVTELLEAELDEKALERQWLEFYQEVNPGPEHREWAESLMRTLAAAADASDDADDERPSDDADDGQPRVEGGPEREAGAA